MPTGLRGSASTMSTDLGALTLPSFALQSAISSLGLDCRAGVQLDDGLDRLAPFLVGHADHRAVLHRGVRPDHLLDLARVHVEPAGDDHVLAAVGDVQVALGVLVADVAGAQPAVDDRRRPSARGPCSSPSSPGRRRRRSRRPRPAAAPRRRRRGSRRVTIGRRPAARGQPLVVGRLAVDEVLLRAQHRDRRRRLGLAVALHHHRAEDVDRALAACRPTAARRRR